MFQNHKQNLIRKNNSEHTPHPNNRQSSHHKTHHYPPHSSHHNSPCPTRLIFFTPRNTTPASHPTFSSTHTPQSPQPQPTQRLPYKQTESSHFRRFKQEPNPLPRSFVMTSKPKSVKKLKAGWQAP